MDYSPGFSDPHSHQVFCFFHYLILLNFHLQNDHYASPMSLPPASATPRSVATREETYMAPLNDHRIPHRPSVASKKSIPEMGPPSTVTSYHLSSVDPATPYTPQALDTSRIQPSLQ